MLGFKRLAWRSVEQPPILPKPNLDAADRRLSPHARAAGRRRSVVRHAPDRRASWSGACPRPTCFPAKDARLRRRHRLVGRAPVHAAGRRCSCRASMPTTCRPACTRTAPRLHGLPPPSIEAVRKAATRNLHLVRPQIARLADMLHGRPAVSFWAARPASPISPPITSCGSSRAGTSIAGRSSYPTRACSPGATAWPRSATASAPTSIPTEALRCRARRRAGDAAAVAAAGRRPTARRSGPRARRADNAKDWVEGEVSFIDAHEIALLRDDPRGRPRRRALSAAGLRLAAGRLRRRAIAVLVEPDLHRGRAARTAQGDRPATSRRRRARDQAKAP